jgi:hypothetical protein
VGCCPLEQRPLANVIPVVSRPLTGGIALGQNMLCAFAGRLPESANVKPEIATTKGNENERNFLKAALPTPRFAMCGVVHWHASIVCDKKNTLTKIEC